jgi:ubiquinone/menaquinone biosynthesis C-methylase UbiE
MPNVRTPKYARSFFGPLLLAWTTAEAIAFRSIAQLRMTTVATDESHTPAEDRWAATADVYSSQAARLTELHGADLIAIIKDDVLRAKTILDVGCGTGAFAKAYVQQFPRGVPGQKLILSDLSAGMLTKAKETLIVPPDFATAIVFQEEDGTQLEGITDESIDIVVSLFGVFLIPDQQATLKSIFRVLKKPNGFFANASWLFDISQHLSKEGYGVSIQDAFRIVVETIHPEAETESHLQMWSDPEKIKAMLSSQTAALPSTFQSTQVYRAIHTSVWNMEAFWDVLCKNPMSRLTDAEEADAKRAKAALISFLTIHGWEPGQPLMFSSASNLAIARGIAIN